MGKVQALNDFIPMADISFFPETDAFASVLAVFCALTMIAAWWFGGRLARRLLLGFGTGSVRRRLMRDSSAPRAYLWLLALAARVIPFLLAAVPVFVLLRLHPLTAGVLDHLRAELERGVESSAVVVAFDLLVILVATVVLLRAFVLSGRLFARLKAALNARRERPGARRFRLVSAAFLRRFSGLVGAFLWSARMAAGALLLLAYMAVIFSLFPVTRDIVAAALNAVGAALGSAGSAMLGYLPNLAHLLAIGLITFGLLHLMRLFAAEVRRGAITIPGFYADWAVPTYQLARVLTLALALVVAFPFLPGSDSPIFHGMSVFFGVLISLGSTSFIANVVAGVVLTYTRAFRVGDRVRIADTQGDVVEKGLLVTRVRTIKNVDVTIPNSLVMSSHMINYSSVSHERHLILNTTVTLSYDLPWRMVHDTLIKAALATPGVLSEPRPFVLQTSLNDYHVSYELNAATDDPNAMQNLYSRLHENIQDCCNAAGFEILSPGYTSVRDGNPSTIPAKSLPPGHENPVFRVEIRPPKPPPGP